MYLHLNGNTGVKAEVLFPSETPTQKLKGKSVNQMFSCVLQMGITSKTVLTFSVQK